MRKFKVAITDCEYESINIEKNILSQIDADVQLYNTKKEEDIIKIARDCDALIFQYANITDKIIYSMKNCKVIAKYATGIDGIDIKAASDKGILFTNVDNYSTDEVANHTVSLILNLSRKIHMYNRETSLGNWDYKKGHPIKHIRDSIVGVIGFGNISKSVISKLNCFCDKIWIYSNHASEYELSLLNAKKESFIEIIEQSDYITIHSPLTDKTRNMFDKEVFKAMKDTSYLINVSRGGLVNETALVDALERNEIAGAALDVMESEPPKHSNPLLKMDNVLITPHAAWYSERSQFELQSTVANEVHRVLSGYLPFNTVNKEIENKLSLKKY
jgi:D-3-phosphoglycerate dehydrogenase